VTQGKKVTQPEELSEAARPQILLILHLRWTTLVTSWVTKVLEVLKT